MFAKAHRWTDSIITVTVAAWIAALLLVQTVDLPLVGGFIPGRLNGDFTMVSAVPAWLTPLSSTLLHDGVLHLGFNMLMLIWCGRQVEPALGGPLLLLAYVIGAYSAAIGQWALGPHETIPTIGASGAISTIIGIYALVFSEQKVRPIGPIPANIVRVLWLALAWVGIQALIGLGYGVGGQGIAIGAHIGGFVAGLLLARPLLRIRFRHSQRH